MKLAQPLGLSSGDGLQSGRNSRKSRDRGLVAVAFILLAFFIWRESSERWGVSHWITRHRETLQDFQEKMFQESGLTEPWSEIAPSHHLNFHDCFDGHKCARLSVPMDWNSTDTNNPRVNLAIIKRPAKVPITNPRYGGLVFLQHGGPGGSGVDLLLKHGEIVQTIVDSPLNVSTVSYDRQTSSKYFDVLGFDVRGVNNTTPHFSCFPNVAARDAWALQAQAEGVLESSDIAFHNIWARTNALSEGCSAMVGESEEKVKLAEHMNTSPVVADIVQIIELHGQWREEETARIIAEMKINSVPEQSGYESMNSEWSNVMSRNRWKRGEEKLLFWGISYGTIVGQTFAALQPHRVERAVIDSVVDTSDYYLGEWKKNLQDTDVILDKFAEYCDTSGPEKCLLYTEGGVEAIKLTIATIVQSLKYNPIGVPGHGTIAPDLITYSDLKLLMREALYFPIQLWPNFTRILHDLLHLNGTSLAIAKQSGLPTYQPSEHCRHAPPYAQECTVADNAAGDVSTAILCSDGNSTYGMTREKYAEYAFELMDQSWVVGDSWAQIRLGCVKYGVQPRWRFGGPFTGETAKGMLFVGNKRDPVTPIRNAHAMANNFPGSAVLQLDSEGHVILGTPSLCMALHIRDYFQTGALPKSGTVCEANEKPFLGLVKPAGPGESELLEKLRWTASHINL